MDVTTVVIFGILLLLVASSESTPTFGLLAKLLGPNGKQTDERVNAIDSSNLNIKAEIHNNVAS